MKWEKLGVVYDPTKDPDRPSWRYDYAQGINTLFFDEYIRIYFCCREKPDEAGRTVSRITFLDVDIDDPMRIIKVADHPILELGGLGEFDEHGQYPFSVIRDGNTIRGFYGGVSRCESVPFNVAIGECISEDGGDHFNRLGKGPILSYSYDEPFVIASPKIRKYNNRFYMFYSAGRKWTQKGENRPEICYKLRLAVSDDCVNWKKMHIDLIPDKLGESESQACGDTIYSNGKYHMFFCYRGHEDFRDNPKHSYRIGYAVSDDLISWTRKDDEIGIDISPGSFDSEMIAYPHVFRSGSDIYMLYLGNNVGKYGFGMARLLGELE